MEYFIMVDRTIEEIDNFEYEFIERFWDIHEFEAYGSDPIEVPPHSIESQVRLNVLLKSVYDFMNITVVD
tara:strand:- start:753 stop:962 length:210 start_codon:yes stop_codon:yes gene_type:complete